MKRLEVNGRFADMSNDTIGLTWQYFDLFNPSKRFNPYTTTIKLPKTPNNVAIFGYGSAVSGRMTAMRDLPNCNLYFGPYKIIANGYLKVQSIDEKTINVQLVSKTDLIDTIAAGSFADIETQAAATTGVISAGFAGAVDSIAAGTNGWLLPRTIEDPITSTTWNIMPTLDVYSSKHELWASVAILLDAIEVLYGCTFKVAEMGAINDLQSSDLYINQLKNIFCPAWDCQLEPNAFPNDWYVWRNYYGRRTIDGETIENANMTLMGGKNPWEFIRIVAQLTCSMLWVDGTDIYFAPFDDLDMFAPVNFTGKIKTPIKYPNLPGFGSKNYLRYNVSDNTPETYGQSIIPTAVKPEDEKDYIKLDITLPGRYYNATENKTLWKTKYQECGDMVIMMHKGTTYVTDTVAYTSGGTTLTRSADLRLLRPVLLLTNYISVYAAAVKDVYYEIDLGLNLYDLMQLKPYKLVRINELGGLFYLNLVNNFDPYSGKAAKVQLIRFGKIVKPLDLPTVAKKFVDDWADDYLPGGVIVTNTGGVIYFTSSVAGQNFKGATSVEQLAEDLSGVVATTQANVAPTARKDQIVFSGATGQGNCTFNAVTHSIKIITTLAAAVTGFVNGWAADYLAHNVTVTSNGTDTLYFEMTTPGTDASGATSYVQNTADLTGIVTTVQANGAAVARIDTVTLVNSRGLINITCDGVTRIAGLIIK